MKMLSVILMLVMLLGCIREGPPEKEKAKYAPGEILIKFKPGTAEETVQSLTTEVGLEKVKDIPEIGVGVYRITSGISVEEAVQKCQQNPQVEYAEPNYEYRVEEEGT